MQQVLSVMSKYLQTCMVVDMIDEHIFMRRKLRRFRDILHGDEKFVNSNIPTRQIFEVVWT